MRSLSSEKGAFVRALFIAAASGFVLFGSSAAAQDRFTDENLRERQIHRRAVEAVIWGMPAVNFQRMVDAATLAGAESNQIVYWSRPLDSRNQTLTPNPDTIYFMPFYDTTDGPVVLEIPAADGPSTVTGSVDDAWQNALADVGPAGADKGAGAKYLIVPPGYAEKVAGDFIVLPSRTFRGFALVRSNYASVDDVPRAAEYGKRMKFYPLAQPDRETVFVDSAAKAFDATIPYDRRFFETLGRFVQAEPWLSRDRAMIDPLKTIGIEKGRPFQPDEATKEILDEAAREARAIVNETIEAGFETPFYDGSRWALPIAQETIAGMSSTFSDRESYPIDARAAMYSMAYFSPRQLGAGQFYLMTIADRDGEPLSGSATYRLVVPADAPVKLYWSVTAYDRETHALIRDMSRSSRASNSSGIQTGADGSVEVYFGPKAPEGMESNWIPTDPNGSFELMFRFYGPEPALFEKTWKLPDLERLP